MSSLVYLNAIATVEVEYIDETEVYSCAWRAGLLSIADINVRYGVHTCGTVCEDGRVRPRSHMVVVTGNIENRGRKAVECMWKAFVADLEKSIGKVSVRVLSVLTEAELEKKGWR